MIRCIAIDDEPKALGIIVNHVSKLDHVDLLATFSDPFQAISFLNNHTVDLLFLDINMPNVNGFDLLKTLTKKPMVIFTTAYSEYAMESYEVNAIDYLLKPFDFPRFVLAVTKAQDLMKSQAGSNSNFIFVNTGNQRQRIDFDDIFYLKAEGNYVSYMTSKGKLLVRSSIKEALALLPEESFIQIHRSYVVAFHQVEKIEDNHVFVADQSIPISSSYSAVLKGLTNLK